MEQEREARLKEQLLKAVEDLTAAAATGNPSDRLARLKSKMPNHMEQLTQVAHFGLTAEEILAKNERLITLMRTRMRPEIFAKWMEVMGPRMDARVNAACERIDE